jgi:putative endonuclease
MTDPRHQLGRRGEDLAAAHLRERGFTVLEQGFRCRFGEIDIIAADCERLLFCEVKTRRSRAFGDPCEAVTWSKQQRLRKTAGWYLASHEWSGEIRFDIFSIVIVGNGDYELEWLEDAFAWE